MTDEELDAIEARLKVASKWTPDLLGEHLTEGVYDVPSLETREEFLDAAKWFLTGALDGREHALALVAEVRRLRLDDSGRSELEIARDEIELLREDRETLAGENKRLRHELKLACANNEERNRALDALHYVWCSGSCDRGVHRYDGKGKAAITPEVLTEGLKAFQRLIDKCATQEIRDAWEGHFRDRIEHWRKMYQLQTQGMGERYEKIRELTAENERLRHKNVQLLGYLKHPHRFAHEDNDETHGPDENDPMILSACLNGAALELLKARGENAHLLSENERLQAEVEKALTAKHDMRLALKRAEPSLPMREAIYDAVEFEKRADVAISLEVELDAKGPDDLVRKLREHGFKVAELCDMLFPYLAHVPVAAGDAE